MSKSMKDHDHPMHKGPHHESFIHPHNRGKGRGDGGVRGKDSMSSMEGNKREKDDEVGSKGYMGKM